jgi:hypothetical protein
MKRVAACAVIAACLSGCAKSPDSIAPAYVSAVTYTSWTCKDLGEESQRLSAALATASTQQENARTNDTVGVLLIGVPVSSLSGDNIAPQIADLKGRIEAVHEATVEKHCK